jgi:transglutaminase-like putative cysteine protease
MVAVDKEVRSIATKIVAGKKAPRDRARALYEHLVVNVGRASPYELRGAGYGNVKFTLSQMKGDDNDIASAFVGLCRSIGIPARSVIGVQLDAARKEGVIADYHSWAEFYLEDVGWVPVDPAEGRSNAARRSYCFGGLDERHVAISYGRDVILVPPQAGPPLNYWVKPYWEGDQKPMPDPSVEMSFTEASDTPPTPAEPTMPTEKPAAPAKPPA